MAIRKAIMREGRVVREKEKEKEGGGGRGGERRGREGEVYPAFSSR